MIQSCRLHEGAPRRRYRAIGTPMTENQARARRSVAPYVARTRDAWKPGKPQLRGKAEEVEGRFRPSDLTRAYSLALCTESGVADRPSGSFVHGQLPG